MSKEVKKTNNIARANLRNGLLFCAPAILGLLILNLYPVISSFYYSFCDYGMLKPPVWVGLKNYSALVKDPVFYTSLWNTFF